MKRPLATFVVSVDFATDYITIEDVGVFGGVFPRTNTMLLPTFNFRPSDSRCFYSESAKIHHRL